MTDNTDYAEFGIYNRQPKSINELDNNKFKLMIHNLPNVSWNVQAANIPAQRLPVALQATSLNPIPRAGTNIEFDLFRVKFIVDEKLNNFIEATNWIRGLGMPITSKTYADLINKGKNTDPGPDAGVNSDGVLTIFSKQNVPLIEVSFKDMFPTDLGELNFTTTDSDVEIITATLSFAYSWFDINTNNI